jgi:hypothetical protein
LIKSYYKKFYRIDILKLPVFEKLEYRFCVIASRAAIHAPERVNVAALTPATGRTDARSPQQYQGAVPASTRLGTALDHPRRARHLNGSVPRPSGN